MRPVSTILATAIAAATIAGGCTLGPDYQRPVVDTPGQFRFAQGQSREAANIAWWERFGDPVLAGLVDEALANNHDVRIAAARVEEFYGALGTTRSAMFPQIGAEFAGQRQRASEDLTTPSPGTNPFNEAQGDLFASWEIDLFGRIRRETEAARAELLASEEARRGVVQSLVSAVAFGYINLRDLDAQLEVSHRTVDSRGQAVLLFEKRFKGGVVSELEVNQARSEYAAALATVPILDQAVAQQENSLSVLIGRNPGPIPRGKRIDEFGQLDIPAGLPSDLLEQRPDIREAEQNLIAANARIGAAKALYFPVISLTGLFGSASSALSGLWTGPAKLWSFAGSAVAPVFTAGGIAGQVKSAEARQKQALEQYQRAVQRAFQETEDALNGVQKTRDTADALGQQVEALRNYARLSRLRYNNGFTSYLEVLDAERSLFNAELQYFQAQGGELSQYILLYKAVGGGWIDQADQLAPQPGVQLGEAPGIFQ